jgi:glutamate-1-semialdehyde 2,1-aminomutase
MRRATVDGNAVERLIAREIETFQARTPGARSILDRARKVLPLGVPSTFQEHPPYPLYVRRGQGSRVWDVDGNEYIDYHLGFGSLAVGHAHPRLVEALSERLRNGSMFAMATEEAVLVAEELCRRFGLDMVRFSNSGTESTMDALRVARGVTGRDLIVKIEGSYHGHHDYVMVSVKPSAEEMGPLDHPASIPLSTGIPEVVAAMTLVVPFNRPDALARTLAEHEGKVAALIIEPVMMNLGIVHPAVGYL